MGYMELLLGSILLGRKEMRRDEWAAEQEDE
jgi:hypothetical protein